MQLGNINSQLRGLKSDWDILCHIDRHKVTIGKYSQNYKKTQENQLKCEVILRHTMSRLEFWNHNFEKPTHNCEIKSHIVAY